MVLQRHDAEDEGAAEVVRGRAPSTSSATRRCTCAARSRTRRCSRRSARCSPGRGGRGRRRARRRCATRCSTSAVGVHARPRAGPGPRRHPRSRAWSEERRQRTLSLADTPVVELPTGSALVRPTAGSSSDARPCTASCRRPITTAAARSPASAAVGDLAVVADASPRIVTVSRLRRRQGRGDDLGDVEPFGDLAEHDVGALGVEVARAFGAATKNHCPPAEFGSAVRAMTSWPAWYVKPSPSSGIL